MHLCTEENVYGSDVQSDVWLQRSSSQSKFFKHFISNIFSLFIPVNISNIIIFMVYLHFLYFVYIFYWYFFLHNFSLQFVYNLPESKNNCRLGFSISIFLFTSFVYIVYFWFWNRKKFQWKVVGLNWMNNFILQLRINLKIDTFFSICFSLSRFFFLIGCRFLRQFWENEKKSDWRLSPL